MVRLWQRDLVAGGALIFLGLAVAGLALPPSPRRRGFVYVGLAVFVVLSAARWLP